jgi:PTS system ascorbate-specific IIC component
MMTTFIGIVREPSVVIALVTLLGLLFQRKSIPEIITGTIKSFMGFILIKLGGSIIGDSLAIFGKIFTHAFNLTGIIPSNEAVLSITLDTLGVQASLILLFAMVINIIVARFTKFKYIYLSLHLMLFMSCAVAAVMNGLGYSQIVTIIIGCVIVGVYMSVAPFALRKASAEITGTDEYVVGHSGMIAYWISSSLGKVLGNKEKSTESIEMPKSISFLRDSIVATTLTMLALFLIAGIKGGTGFVTEMSGGLNFFVYCLKQSAMLAGGLFVAKQGVNLFTEEIVPAFKGFAKVFAPGATPAVDVLVLFDKSPNAVLIGFLTSLATGVVCILIFPLIGLPVIVPGLMACFITGGAAAIYGNATGGLRGAIIGSVIDGLFLCIMPAITLFIFASMNAGNVTFADSDLTVTSLILWLIARFF